MNFVLGGKGRIGTYIRGNRKKLMVSGEDPCPYPFPLVYNFLYASCYCHKMIMSYLLWQEKKIITDPWRIKM